MDRHGRQNKKSKQEDHGRHSSKSKHFHYKSNTQQKDDAKSKRRVEKKDVSPSKSKSPSHQKGISAAQTSEMQRYASFSRITTDLPNDSNSEAKWDRIDKWRRNGAKYLHKQETVDDSNRATISRKDSERRESPKSSDDKAQVVKFEKRRHASHHGRVESTESSRVTSPIRETPGIARSLHTPLNEKQNFLVDSTTIPKLRSSLKSTAASSKSQATCTTATSTSDEENFENIQNSNIKNFVLKCTNLPLSLTLNDLKTLFPQSTSVTISTKEESNLSIGQVSPVNPTALVNFTSKGDALEVLANFQGLQIRGQAIGTEVVDNL